MMPKIYEQLSMSGHSSPIFPMLMMYSVFFLPFEAIKLGVIN